MSANLKGTFLWSANLQGAMLRGANLEVATFGFVFGETNLAGVDLEYARGLTQKQLDRGACGDETTKLPKGLTIKLCPDETGKSD